MESANGLLFKMLCFRQSPAVRVHECDLQLAATTCAVTRYDNDNNITYNTHADKFNFKKKLPKFCFECHFFVLGVRTPCETQEKDYSDNKLLAFWQCVALGGFDVTKTRPSRFQLVHHRLLTAFKASSQIIEKLDMIFFSTCSLESNIPPWRFLHEKLVKKV